MAVSKKFHKNCLPTSVTDEDLVVNPKFAQLLNVLSKKIGQDGTSFQSKKELQQAEINFSSAHYNWLMSHIPHYELHELLTTLELQSVERMLSPDEEQFKDVLSEAVSTSELEDYLSIYSNPTSTSTLFGLTQSEVERHNPIKHLLPAVQQAVLPLLEDRLKKKCQELYDFISTNSATVSDKLLSAKVLSLPGMVEEQQQQLSRDKTLLKENKAKKRDHFLLCYQTLLECLSSMESLIKGCKFKTQADTDLIQVKSLESECAAIVLKARKTQLQVICDTYTSDNVKALKVISGHLDTAIRQTEKELVSTQQALNAYYTLGSDFKQFADEFSHLKTEVDNHRWGLQQFVKARGEDGGDIHDEHAEMAQEFSGITLTGTGTGGDEEEGAVGGISL